MNADPTGKHTFEAFRFEGDEETPNNLWLPLVGYRGVVPDQAVDDAAAWLERTFARNGWSNGWRNGIYPFLHFYTATHEVLGIAHGRATVEFGGAKGRPLAVTAGDVIVLPAGAGHKRLDTSADLLVVGAYPRNGQFDQKRPGQVDGEAARRSVVAVLLPERDPVLGPVGR